MSTLSKRHRSRGPGVMNSVRYDRKKLGLSVPYCELSGGRSRYDDPNLVGPSVRKLAPSSSFGFSLGRPES